MSYSGRVGTSELIDLLISFIVLTVSFYLVGIGNIQYYGLTQAEQILIVAVAVGTGFMLHELSHKFVAQRYGYHAEYKSSMIGLALAFFMAFAFHFVFAAPGAVVIRKLSPYSSQNLTDNFEGDDAYWDRLERKTGKEDLWISLAGPVTNIILTMFFFALLMSGMLTTKLLIVMALTAFQINLMLAAFNLIPIDPLDGGKIFRGNALIWAVVAVPTILLALGMFFGYISF
jgi:Zn-dependent protease